jgi:hypothetical protein
MPETAPPRLAVVLATDRYETIRPVIRHLSRQTIRDQIEVVIVGPDPEPAGSGDGLGGFARVACVKVESIFPVAPARAAGVRAARAPLIFIGETHTYAHPTWAENLVQAQSDSWAGVVPGFGNANPRSPLSWSLFLLDYGQWIHLLPPREATIAPTHNGAFRRQVLLDLGGGLERALAQGDTLTVLLRAAGHRMYFEPAARIDHLNVAQWWPWMQERFLGGRLLAGRRAERWSIPRRVVYFCGSPLIPFLLVARLRNVLGAASRAGQLPAGTLPAVLLGGVISMLGEMVGYVFGTGREAERKMMEFELHKVRYASPRAPAPA